MKYRYNPYHRVPIFGNSFTLTKMSKRALEHGYEKLGAKTQKFTDIGKSVFRLKRTEEYEGSFPVYKQPQEVTSYSIDHERHVWFDNREMVMARLQFLHLV